MTTPQSWEARADEYSLYGFTDLPSVHKRGAVVLTHGEGPYVVYGVVHNERVSQCTGWVGSWFSFWCFDRVMGIDVPTNFNARCTGAAISTVAGGVQGCGDNDAPQIDVLVQKFRTCDGSIFWHRASVGAATRKT